MKEVDNELIDPYRDEPAPTFTYLIGVLGVKINEKFIDSFALGRRSGFNTLKGDVQGGERG